MHTLVMDLEPGYIGTKPGFLYRFNRDLYETITSSHLVLHTKPGRIKNFKLSGVTRQVETTGAQLLDVNQIPKGTEGGATLDIVDDQIIISGSGALTSTFGRSKKLTHEETMQLIGDNRTFTLSVTQYINPPAFVNFADASKNLMTLSTLTATSITRTIPENMDMDTLYIYYGVSNIAGAEIVPGTARVMLNAGDTALPWEPYTGATSSPSPEYPQNIQGVGVRTNNEPYGYRTDVVTRSKNLVNISMISPTYQQIPNGFVLDAATDGRRIARMPCQLQAGVEYAYKFRCHYNMPGHLVDLYLPKIKQYFVENRDGDIIFGTFIPTADTDTFSVYFQSEAAGTGVTAEITELQVEEGSTPTSYQPYAYYTAPIYTREPLTQWDHLEYRNGEYGVVKKSAVVVEDGSRNVDDTHYPILFFSTLAKPMNVDAKVYCNYCSSERIGRLSILGKNICINSADTYWGFANAPECKAWLTQKNAEGKPLYYCYETAEESWEPLPAISQQALRNLPTYKGTTIIDTTDPLAPEITVSYRAQTDYSKLPGLEVDYEKCTTTRLGAAKNLTAGPQFNRFPMYAGRRRCNVSDNGTITAYVGDHNYRENGSNGQVMVYQPKFYYQVVPLKTDPQTDGIGYHLRRAQYWVSPKPQPEFKLHPAFINASGQEVDHILLSAYESSLYDTSALAYILDDAQVMDVAADKLSSIAGAKPASGKTQQLTRVNAEKLAQNRGSGWHGDTIKAESANQLLMAIELGALNIQAAIGNGVVSIPDAPNTENNSIITGGTSNLGNTTGMANGTSGKVSVTYRGMENPWGNIWKMVDGINAYMDNKGLFHAYVCNDFAFAESKGTGNYEEIGFHPANTDGYISAMGYSDAFDWLFIPSETRNSSTPLTDDYYFCNPTWLNSWRIALLGAAWPNSDKAGAFYWHLYTGVELHYRNVGSRLTYVPQ